MPQPQHGVVGGGAGSPSSVGTCVPASYVTAHIGCAGGVRQFEASFGACHRNFTILDAMPVFTRFQFFWTSRGESDPNVGIVWGTGNKGRAALNDTVERDIAASGLQHARRVDRDLRGWLSKRRRALALEFGCGNGRLAMAWTRHFDAIDCVDQSMFHVQAALRNVERKRAEVGGSGAVRGVVATPDLLRHADGRRYDFVNCVQVLQHTSPPLQQMYLEQFCDALRVGGRGWVHFWEREAGENASCGLDASGGFGRSIAMQSSMNAFPLRSIRGILAGRGCAALGRIGQNFRGAYFKVAFLKCGVAPLGPGGADSPECSRALEVEREDGPARDASPGTAAAAPPRLEAACAAEAQVTAHIGCDGGARRFAVSSGACRRSFTVLDVMPAFYRLQYLWTKLGRADLHHGVGRGAEKAIVGSGARHASAVDLGLKGWLKERRRTRALEFGCGDGRLALQWARHFDVTDCVDQSVFHLDAALAMVEKKRAEAGGTGVVNGIVSTPDLLRAVDGQRYDFVHSMQALQHMPAPMQQVYMEQLCDVLGAGGRGWVHLLGQEPTGADTCGVGVEGDSGLRLLGQPTNHTFPVRSLPAILRQRGCAVTFSGLAEGSSFPYYVTFAKCSGSPPGSGDTPECSLPEGVGR